MNQCKTMFTRKDGSRAQCSLREHSNLRFCMTGYTLDGKLHIIARQGAQPMADKIMVRLNAAVGIYERPMWSDANRVDSVPKSILDD